MRAFLQNLLNLREHADFEKTKATISDGVALRGYNLWILVCSTVLASIGLDTNSTAVIIGAMLISPLMSPILGVGFSLAIHDKQLLIRSLRDLFLAVFISLLVSILYFFLSPLGEPTPELQSRTFPTLLDVLVALFGGIAGIVSITRHDQTNAIPGVAIATALMPPLCTAGFGLATMHWNYFLGAFYLFFINAVFISLATYLIVRYLHFPEKKFLNRKLELQYHWWFTIIGFILLAPSIYFLYSVYKKEIVKKDIDTLVISEIKKQGNEILKWDVVDRDTAKLIKVYYSGLRLKDSLKTAIDSTLHTHQMEEYQLFPMRINLTKNEVSELSAEMTRQMFRDMHLEEILEQSVLARKSIDSLPYVNLQREVLVAFPFVDTMYIGRLTLPAATGMDTLPAVFYQSRRGLNNTQQKQVYQYLKVRLAKDTLLLIRR
jgi:uncharacterized hydrophobic protein (TIGR00271 family)